MYITLDRLVEKTCQGKTNKEIVDFLEKFVFDVLQPMLNKGLSKMVESLGAPKCMLEFKLECIGTAIIYCVHPRSMITTSNIGKVSVERLFDLGDHVKENIVSLEMPIKNIHKEDLTITDDSTVYIMRKWVENEDMIRIQTDTTDVLVTADHMVLITRGGFMGWVAAADLEETDEVVYVENN
jgi:hypothetical protein